MTVVAPVPGPAPVEALHLGPRSLPNSGSPVPVATLAGQSGRGADQITLTPAPSARALWDLAANGLRQLSTLLPALERLVQDDTAEASPLGFLARALGDAAHSIDAGAQAMSTKDQVGHPSLAGFDIWRQTATTTLHDASDLLKSAEQRLSPTAADLASTPRQMLRAALQAADPAPRTDPARTSLLPNPLQLAAPPPAVNPDMLWAFSQVIGAQRQVGLALDRLSHRPTLAASRLAASRPTAVRPLAIDIRGAIAVAGLMLAVLFFTFVDSAAGLGAALIAVAAALAWGWRVVISSRSLRLELRDRT